MLRYNGMVMKDSTQPSQYLINLGLAKWHMVKRRYRQYGMVIFHERCLEYFKQRIESGKIQIGFEKKRQPERTGLTIDDVC